MSNLTNLDNLVTKSKRAEFSIGQYSFISQDPNAIPEEVRTQTVSMLLPQFLSIWQAIEQVTGYRWKCTSYIRNSPSHKRGQAFDLAPDIADSAFHQYAVNNQSDPVLYKREKLIQALQTLTPIDFSQHNLNRLGIFIEPDHLHIQALASDDELSPTSVVKWKIEKPLYPDSKERMKLPLIK